MTKKPSLGVIVPIFNEEKYLEESVGRLLKINAIKQIILVDDILATGGTISSACNLCIKAGYKVKQALVFIDLVNAHAEQLTLSNGIKVESLIQLD